MDTLPYRQNIGFTYEYYVIEQIKNDYEYVWHWRNFPEKLMYENNLIKDYETFSKYRYDIGADLVAYKDKQYYFIQCKNFNDTIHMEKLAGFYFLLYEYNLTGIVYYNGTMSQRVLDLSTKVQFINMPMNNNIIDIIKNIEIPTVIRDYQTEACNTLINKPSAILRLPCGMGKTFVASLLAKDYDNIIILSPLRYLTLQTLEHFKKFLGIEYNPILVSTDGKRKNLIFGKKNIISSTYDSADIVLSSISKLKNVFIIIDEFHNLSDNNINNKNNDIYKLLQTKNNKVFLSATPLKDFMDIKDIYNYKWKDAIEKKYICDFNIYIPDNSDDHKLFNAMITKIGNINNNIGTKAYFMLKSMMYNGSRKCICYMTCIEKAKIMCVILSWMHKLLNIDCDFWQIDCTTKKTIRENIITNFKTSQKIAIIVNVHILDEGINIPECDSVFITKPGHNIVNIVQRMCRANRIMSNKNVCNIYLWCTIRYTNKIIDYIFNNIGDYVKNKIFIYSTNNTIKQYKIKIQNKIILHKNNNIIVSKKTNFKAYILKRSEIPSNFIDDFYSFYEMCEKTYYGIFIDNIIKYLEIKNVNRFYENFKKKFIENIDYIKKIIKNEKMIKGEKYIMYYLNLNTFEKICMVSKAEKANQVRDYFIILRKFMQYYKNNISSELIR